jgi:biotin transporter BioY
MNKKPLTNRHWFLLTTVAVVLFCFWPNFLIGFFVVLFVMGWLVHDARTFVQTLWRIILGLIILVSGGLTYACLVTEITGDRPTQVTLGSIVFASAVFGLVRSLIKARID